MHTYSHFYVIAYKRGLNIMKRNFIWQIVIAFALAVITGIIFKKNAKYVQPLGDLFLRLIKFIIVLFILLKIIIDFTSAENEKKLTRVVGKTIAYYLVTSFLAISIGLLAGFAFSPGTGVDITAEEPVDVEESEGVVQTLLNIVPTNPVEALVEADMLQIIFFAIFIGIGIILVGDKATPVNNFFDSLAEIMYKITGIVMTLVPLGIFGLLAPIVGEYGVGVLMPLIKVIIAMLIACIVHMGIIYSISVKTFGNMSPIHFFKGIFPAGAVAFSTASSAGTLPVTIRNAQENLGVSHETSSFILPLGATINMDGTAIYQGITVVFIAQYFGASLTFGQLLTVALIATLASIGTAGVPGAGMVMLTMVLTAVNLPLEGIALIAGIDRILDMMRTAVNVIGDASASVVVDASEKKRETAA